MDPDAIFNAGELKWREIDDRAVVVSMDTAGGMAGVALLLDEAGDIIAIEAENRPRAGDTPARWFGRFRFYVQAGAYRFPRYGEIAWDLPEGEFVYWRDNILSIAGGSAAANPEGPSLTGD